MELVPERRAEVEGRLRTLGWIAPDEPLRALAPAGAGNMNRTLRAELPARTLILKQAVPFVAKFPEIAAPVERLDVEAAFYRLIAGSAALAMRTPRVLGQDPAEHLLWLEDLGNAGDLTWIYAGQAAIEPRRAELRGQLTALWYWLWKLHALDPEHAAGPDGVPRVLENRAMRALNHAHIFEIPFDTDNGVALAEPLRAQQAELAADRGLRERAAALGNLYLGSASHASRPALLHGDYYPGSWLAHPRMGVMVIDPEFAFVGPPEFDVGVLLAHLVLAGYGPFEAAVQLRSYVTPPGFEQPLAFAFAGIEIIRRLLGVAQLPLAAGTEARVAWLEAARQLMNNWEGPRR
jgi:5-methylthioribose kinase